MDQDNTNWTVARIPGVMRETVCTVVHQRTASLDSERGIDDGSEVHEGRRQTVRRELNSQSTGRPRLKFQNMPDCLSLPITVLHEASTTPDPTKNPCLRNSG